MSNEKKEKEIWWFSGYLGRKFERTGTTQSGNEFYSSTISRWEGKDRDNKNIYSNVGFTAWNSQIDAFEEIINNAEDPERIQITVYGYPFADSYMNKDGELVQKLGIKLRKDNFVEPYIWEGPSAKYTGEEPDDIEPRNNYSIDELASSEEDELF